MSIFPAALATVANLQLAINNTKVALAVNAGIGDTTITVDDASPLQSSGYLTFDDDETNPETIYYTGKSGNDLTGVTRGADGTSAGVHTAGANLELRWNAAYHNLLVTELIAVMTNLRDRFGLNVSIIIPTGVHFQAPQETTTQRDALTSLTAGMWIINTTTGQINFYDGSNWLQLASINANGDIVLGTAAKGVIMKTPDGAHTVRIAVANVDADGNSSITTEVVS